MADANTTQTTKAAPKAAKVSKAKIAPVTSGKVAIVLVRGLAKVRHSVKQTLWMFGLRRVNQCVVVEVNPSILGMLQKAKDYITWGPVEEGLYSELVSTRGEEYKGRETDSKGKYTFNFVEVAGKKYKKVFRLNPPSKGYGRGGVKKSFASGGALGNRGEAMADLLKRMM